MNLLLLVGCGAIVAVAVAVVSWRLGSWRLGSWRLASARKGADLAVLHPLELGYLNSGTQLAAVVACVGLHERGMLVRSAAPSAGLEVLLAEDPDRHPVEQDVAAAVTAGVGGRDLVAAMRATPAMVVVRDRLISQGLLTSRFGHDARTRSGRAMLGAASGAAQAGSAGSGEAARRVAALGSGELSAVAPALARALGSFPQPRRLRWDAGAVVSRTIRRRATNGGRMAVGESSNTTFSSGYYVGGGGGHGHLP